jgi:basic membrane protein A
VGCTETKTPSNPAGKKIRIGLMITPQGLNDMGFNDLAYNGLKSASRKYDLETVVIEPSTMKDPEASLRFFAGQTFDAIIAVGVAFADAIKKVAHEHPKLTFYVIDSDISQGKIHGISFREDEGSFLCGFLAGKFSKTHKVGFIGGMKNEVISRFYKGFSLGVAAAASSTQVIEQYMADDFSGFNRAKEAEAGAKEMYQQGCDVIYHAAGASGLGVISAAAETRKFAIGVDKNQDSMAPGHVLTSMLKRVDLVVEEIAKALAEGKPESIRYSYGLKEGAIDLTDFQFSRPILGDALIQETLDLKQKIISGVYPTVSPANP